MKKTPQSRNVVRRMLGRIPVKTRRYKLARGAKVQFYMNTFGEVIGVNLSRDWTKEDFGIPRGLNIFQSLKGGYQNRGGWSMSLAGWRGLLQARHRARTLGKGYDKYWNSEIQCVVICDSDDEVLPFTKAELIEISALRRQIKRGKVHD